jgi:NADH:ubiquinone oxidoreductase subunit 5 (subunit L)/multisubunit Na+/H+ antiporter MnhA subunit
MIAFPTISQIPYMFLAIHGASTLVSPFHIIIHALFKSLSFLLSGSPIHVRPNLQSIYKPKINHSFINIIFILAGSVLIVPLSKEGIIHSSICIISPAFVTMIAVLGGIFTMIYTSKIY